MMYLIAESSTYLEITNNAAFANSYLAKPFLLVARALAFYFPALSTASCHV